MAERNPTPYSSFNSYNKFEAEQNKQKEEALKKQQMSPQMSPQQQQMIQQRQMTQQNQRQMGQMQQQTGQMQQQMSQMPQQMGQMPQQMGQQIPSRFKHIQSPEHLQNILTNGVDHFQSNFKAKGLNPPPMRLFLKLYTEWCTPCKKISPVLDEISLSEQTKDIIFMKFDADQVIKNQDPLSKQLVNNLKIGAVPAFYGFIDGKMVGSVMGADRSEIDQLLQKLLS